MKTASAAETSEQLTDRLRLRELVDAYAHCADRRDASGQMALFTEDARFLVFYDVRSEHPSETHLGRETLAPVFGALTAYQATTHFNGQSTVTLDGDRASGVSYCLAHHVTRADGEAKIMVASIRYLDQFVRTSEGWRFDERRLMVDWMDTRAIGS